MQIRDLEAVLAVYRYKSFSEAAYKTNFSISAISKQIARVEKDLGVKLFLRKTKGGNLLMTPEGELLIPAMQAIIDEYSNLEYLVDNLHETDTGVLTIGCSPLIGTIGETEIISDFLNKYPDIQLDIITRTVPELMNMLVAGELDGMFALIFNVGPGEMRLIETLIGEDISFIQTMRNRELFLGISADHPLSGRDTIQLKDVLDETFIFSSLQSGVKYESRIGELQRLIDGENHELKTRFVDFTNREIALNMVESGRGVLPQVVKPVTGGHRIKYVKVENWPDEAGGLFVCRKSNRSKALKSFLKCVRVYAQKEGLLKDHETGRA